ncbi:H-type lectin domain-containing protein [Candidatus Magnetaquicoccus inordinatus]|uniref:H-type lectin domain-containing protein n=1 Tax=Candidatus Magnetaquicoccus inordinatus TaxID=2496818 RepID=UPI00102B3649|nr:H-type lectin domain-containing protein [Candidatus Magnetaquicoccus inordinatus]
MKIFLTVFSIICFVVILLNQPWEKHQENTPSSAVTTTNPSSPQWLSWLHDQRLPAVQERLHSVEERLQKMTQDSSLAERVTEAERKLLLLSNRPAPTLQMENGSVIAKKGDSNWKLTDIFARLRQYRHRVTFLQPFAHPPKIVLGITLLELPAEKVRLHSRAEEIDTQGFTLVFESRSESRIEEMQVDWFAFADQP